MGRRAGIEIEDIVAAAAMIADRDGLVEATLTAVANQLGIKTPSLYNHVEGLAGLQRLLALHGSRLLLASFREAAEGRSGADALRALARADRRFAIEHPGLYESFLPAPRQGEDEELYNAMAAPVFVVADVLLAMGVPQRDAIHLIRAMRALLHGFVDLEAKAGFGLPVDIDVSFDESVELIIAGIEAAARKEQVSAEKG